MGGSPQVVADAGQQRLDGPFASTDAPGGSSNTGDGSAGVPVWTGATDAATICRLACDRAAACDMKEDGDTCMAVCMNSNAAVVPKLQVDVLRQAATCAQAADCRTVLAGKLLAGCVAQAKAAAAASAAATAFCDAYFTRADACLGAVSKVDCLDRTKLYSDAAVGAAMGCIAKTCSLLNPCVQATLNGSVGTGGVEAGVPAVKLCTGNVQPCSSFSSYSSYDSDRCSKVMGCSGATNCMGNLSCVYFSTKSTCEADGCTWSVSGSFGQCNGTPTVKCADMATAAACQQKFPCSWRTECSGTVVTCDKIAAASCGMQPGCVLQ